MACFSFKWTLEFPGFHPSIDPSRGRHPSRFAEGLEGASTARLLAPSHIDGDPPGCILSAWPNETRKKLLPPFSANSRPLVSKSKRWFKRYSHFWKQKKSVSKLEGLLFLVHTIRNFPRDRGSYFDVQHGHVAMPESSWDDTCGRHG